MRVCLVTAVFPPCRGGMSTSAFYEAEAIARQGHAVTVLTPHYRRLADLPQAGESDWPFRTVRLAPAPEAGNTAMCWSVLRRIDAADVVYLHYPFFGTAELVWLGKLFGHPALKRARLVLRYHMDVMAEGARRAFFLAHARAVMPGILKQADAIIFSTLDYARHSRAARIVSQAPHKCFGIPFGIRADRFFRDPRFQRDPRRLLFVGGLDRAHHFKGVSHLLDAVAVLRQTFPNVTLRIVGNGDRLPGYRDQCTKLALEECVDFVTACTDDELHKHYCESAVTILPSTSPSEAFGIVLIESMACGTPVVATALPGVRTLVTEGSNGWLVPYTPGLDQSPALQAQHTRALVATLTRILSDPEQAEAMGRNAFDTVCPSLFWETVAGRITSVLWDGRDPTPGV